MTDRNDGALSYQGDALPLSYGSNSGFILLHSPSQPASTADNAARSAVAQPYLRNQKCPIASKICVNLPSKRPAKPTARVPKNAGLGLTPGPCGKLTDAPDGRMTCVKCGAACGAGNSKPKTSIDRHIRARSSIGQSTGFVFREMEVRLLPGAPTCPSSPNGRGSALNADQVPVRIRGGAP